jgi:hypothetical protein
MALKSNWSKSLLGFDNPAQKENAFIRVDSVVANKKCATARVIVYANAPENDSPAQIIDEVEYSFVPSVAAKSTNFVAQAYEYLKSLPEFENATDC